MNNREKWLITLCLFVLSLILLVLSSCDSSTDEASSPVDIIPPGDVIGPGVSTADSQIILSWVDSGSGDVETISITWTDGITPGSAEVAPGIQAYTIGGLTNYIEYSVTLVCIDTSGNSSPGRTVTAIPGGPLVHYVYTNADLYAIRGNVYTGWDLDDDYILMADLDLSSFDAGDGTGWLPIGDNSTSSIESRFTGTFDGNDHVIFNLAINREADYQGLFGYIYNAEINDLGLEDISVTGNTYCGGLAGYSYADVENCYVTGEVNGYNRVGGLIGFNSSRLSYCDSTAEVYSETGMCGGLAGRNHGNIQYCFATGNIDSPDRLNGGLVGYNDRMTGMGNILYSYATGDVSGTGGTGGFIGQNEGHIANCYATGDVIVTPTGSYGGGFAGANGYSIEDCYSTGTASGGLNQDYINGFAGYNDATMNDCFYDSETSGHSDTDYGTPHTTAEMQTVTTFTDPDGDPGTNDGWDFVLESLNGTDDIWSMDGDHVINGGYPYLAGLVPE